MSHWNETAEILRRLEQTQASGQRAALATVIHIAGSAYRRPGAKLLVESGGATLGGVSGGCLESDVRETARQSLESGETTLRRYDMRTDESVLWGLGLGCAGEVEVLVQPALASYAPIAARLRELLGGDAPFAIVTALDGATRVIDRTDARGSLGDAEIEASADGIGRQLLADGESGMRALGERVAFFEVLRPPPQVLVVGAGDDALPLVEYATECGFRVTVADHRTALLAPGRFGAARAVVCARAEDESVALPIAGSLAVVKTHSLAHDRAWVARLLAGGAAYIGLLGPRARGAAIRREAGAADDPRIFAPVGLDVGADGARQIAVSIVAELLSFTANRAPRHLCEREEAIHAG